MGKSDYGLSTELCVHKTDKATFAVYANLKKPADSLFCRVVSDDSKFRLDINDFSSNGKGNNDHAIYNIDVDDMLDLYENGLTAMKFSREYKFEGSKIISSAENNGTCPAYRLSITRNTTYNNPWIIQITNGRAKPKRSPNGACMEESGSFVKTTEGKVFLKDKAFNSMIHKMYEKWREVGFVYAMQSIGLFDQVYANYNKGSYKSDLTPTPPSSTQTPAQDGSYFENINDTTATQPQPVQPVNQPESSAKSDDYVVTAVITSDFMAVGGVYMAEIVVNGKKSNVYFREISQRLQSAKESGSPVSLTLYNRDRQGQKMILCRPD